MAGKLLVLWPTSRCNLSCVYCYAAGHPPADMALETALRGIDLMGGEDFTLQFAGGEPLLNFPLIERVLRYARETCGRVRFALQTNGTLLNERIIGVLKHYRVALGVSLDGRPEINDALRGETGAAVKGLLLLREAALMANLTAVVCDLNIAALRGIADMALFLGNVAGIGLDLLRPAGRAAGPDPRARPPSPAALRKGLGLLRSRVAEINACSPRPLVVREFERTRRLRELAGEAGGPDVPGAGNHCCACTGDSLVVLPNGECYPCGSLAGDPRFRMGNVHAALEVLALSRPPGGACGHCGRRRYCTGGCPARPLLRGGFDELDCVMTETLPGEEEETYKKGEYDEKVS
ncbi:MAG: radical SAM protein [Spirochaetaceae bacterium]|jgi:uncharacterized protein|nr:radical SAM protein [Spirochaetaceae bacterium]